MTNLVIFCGGTGGIALQEGIDTVLGNKNINLNILINAYDNGKSTGECRKAFKGAILGPSDLRKNQLTQFKLAYKNQLLDSGSYESKLLKLFSTRFSADTWEEYYNKAWEIISNSLFLDKKDLDTMLSWLDFFFYDTGRVRNEVRYLDYSDFSISNIFYAACTAMNDNSLEKSGTIMAQMLDIRNNIKLISNRSLFLKAITEKGQLIDNEEAIVEWDNAEDRIKECWLETPGGEYYTPYVGEENQCDIKKIILDADILIFSSGTQWSSLIPTYKHEGFPELISRSKAKKYLVMNNVEDHDMYGVDANGVLEILNRYLDVANMRIVVNSSAVSAMNSVSEKYDAIVCNLSADNSQKHDPQKLVKCIMRDYFGIKKDNYIMVADLDGTLWDEKAEGYGQQVGDENLRLFDGIILSGNNFEHVKEICKEKYLHTESYIYCDYGNTFFKLGDIDDQKTLLEKYIIGNEVVDILEHENCFHGKCSLRGRTIITIKPLSEREKYLKLVNKIIGRYNGKYYARLAGRTSIDITVADFAKDKTLMEIIRKNNFDIEDVIYVGNELECGNDVSVKKTNIQTIQVNDIFEMNNFIKTYR